MDRVVIEQKLESLRRCLQRVQTKCPADADALAADFDLQDIVSLNLSRAVQLCVDIGAHLIASTEALPPDTMGQTFDQLAQTGVIDGELAINLKKAVGFRNIAMHHYDAINWIMVHNIVQNHLTDFSAFARVVTAQLGSDPNSGPGLASWPTTQRRFGKTPSPGRALTPIQRRVVIADLSAIQCWRTLDAGSGPG